MDTEGNRVSLTWRMLWITRTFILNVITYSKLVEINANGGAIMQRDVLDCHQFPRNTKFHCVHYTLPP